MDLQKLTAYAKKHPRTLLVFLVLLTACIAYHPYIFGKSVFLFTDIGSDTTEQYIMQYSSVVNHIRNGNFSLWDFTNGFGTSMYQLNLFHPLLWLLYLAGVVFGPQVMPGCLIYVHILTMVLASLAVWSYLSCFSLSRRSRILAAYIYAFNGFMTVWGQHYQLSAILIWLPLLLMLAEKAMQKRRFSPLLSVVTALMVLSSYYLSYMALLVLAVYVILRLLILQKGEGPRLYVRSLIRQGLNFLLGVGMGLVNLLPSFYLVSHVSSRLDSGMSLVQKLIYYFAPYPSTYYKTLARKLLSSNLEGIGSATSPYTGYLNYYEAPNLFFSTLFFFLLVQFAIYFFRNRGTKGKRRGWMVTLLALAGGTFSLLIMDGSLAFNAFSYPISRHTFLLMPFFALMAAVALDRILVEKRICLVGLLVAGIFTLWVYVVAAQRANTFTFFCNAAALLVTGLGMALCLVAYAWTKKAKIRKVSVSVLTLLLACNLACDTWTTVAGRDPIKRGSSYFENLYGKDSRELSAWLLETDTSFYRLEKDYSAGSQCMDSLGQYYRGISTYNSTLNKNILEFADKVLPSLYFVNKAHLSFCQIVDETDMAALLGVKYLVSTNPDLENKGYRLLQTFGSLYLYENTSYSSFASFYTQEISADTYETASASQLLDTGKLLSQYVILNEEAEETETNVSDSQTEMGETAVDLSTYALQPDDSIQVDPEALTDDVTQTGENSFYWSQRQGILPLADTGITEGNADASTKESENVAEGNATDAEIEEGDTIVTFNLTADNTINVEIRTGEEENYYMLALTAGQATSVTLRLPKETQALYFTSHAPGAAMTLTDLQFWKTSEDSMGTGESEGALLTMEDTGNDSHLTCQAEVSQDGILFFPIPYEEGWSATVNGEEVELLRADYGFTAIRISAGNQTVELTYHAPLFRESLILTLISWIIFLILTLHLRRRRR